MSIDTSIIAQDYVNVFELFDVARAAANLEAVGYTTWLDGTVRTLQTCLGAHAEQIVQRYDASGRPYPVDDELPHGWATVCCTTDNDDGASQRHDGSLTTSADGWPPTGCVGAGSAATSYGSSAAGTPGDNFEHRRCVNGDRRGHAMRRRAHALRSAAGGPARSTHTAPMI